tara:strand:- start:166 stop:642 length:477 start_codon:yes stop_codon:yes gene_type:complete
MFRIWNAIALLVLVTSGPAGSHEFKFGEVGVATPWARATIGAGKNAVAFLIIHNRGPSTVRLVGASTPIARHASLHTHQMDKGIMKMRPVDTIEVAPGEAAALEPGGLHIMLIGLKYPLKEGSSFPLTLTFEEVGSATIKVDVRSATAGSGHAHKTSE